MELRKAALEDAISNFERATKNLGNNKVEEIVEGVSKKFFENQVKNFPKYCQHAHSVNFQESKFLEQYGNKGKFTDSYGWSKDRTMKHKWVVPMDLKMFMHNIVYRGFWEEENKGVRDWFMKQICKGGTTYDYEQLLKKVVMYYGADYSKPFKKVIEK